ncbi:MAG TPA: response regulator [Pedobacter sp.]|jgi:CheY-like chemotaxis protein/signal transduction histidine kinase/CHASE3 domain sensor protein
MQKISFKRLVFTGFLATITCVLILGIVSFLNIRELQSNEKLVEHTEKVLYQSNKVSQQLLGAESSGRGFIITGRPQYLSRYNQYVHSIKPALTDLRQLVVDNPAQIVNVDSLNHHLSERLKQMEDVLSINKSKGLEAASVFLGSDQVRHDGNKVKYFIEKIEKIENNLLVERKAISEKSANRTITIIVGGISLVLCLVFLLSALIKRTFDAQRKTELDALEANALIGKVSEENRKKNWLLTGSAVIDDAMRGMQDVDVRAKSIIAEVAKYVNAEVGAIYLTSENGQSLTLEGGYAFKNTKPAKAFAIGEGLIGQAALEKKRIVFHDVPADYITITSGLGKTTPKCILIQPFLFQDQLKGVLELAFASEIKEEVYEFFDTVIDSVAVGINAAQGSLKMQILMEQTQQQAEELETQHEELRATNEELIKKTQLLQVSEEELMVQQEELKQTNAEIEEKAQLLEERNKAIELAKEAIALKAEELELSSKYKSDFLANMSHELRTPLNSILILAKILKENKPLNLSPEQIKYAGVIHNAGSDLLTLINDILDLSKIESGKVDLTIEEVEVNEIKVDMEMLFKEVANNKKINFEYQATDDVPLMIKSDRMRVEQILKNLLSNAFKFTPESGTVTMAVSLAAAGHHYYSESLKGESRPILAYKVQDSGIGIPDDKQKVIFEAFQQADGSTSRKYGGTGLGLSISRQLANLLGGEIQVESVVNQGSSFTLYLPIEDYVKRDLSAEPKKVEEVPQQTPVIAPRPEALAAPLETLKLADPNKEYTLLIIEDDTYFADILKDYAENRGFKTLTAYQGDTGFEMAKESKPDAIVLDIMLPVIDGWSVLKKLKDDPDTCNIPVHLMSAKDEKASKAKEEGALGFLRKPVEKEELQNAFDLLIKETGNVKLSRVLLVEDQQVQSDNLTLELVSKNIKVEQSFNGVQTMEILSKDVSFDCIILDLKLPDISGLDLLEKIKADERLVKIPVVINTAMELDKDSMSRVMKHTHVMVLKNNKSNDRILDEVNLFMNKIRTNEPVPTKPLPYQAQGKPSTDVSTLEKALKNRSVLVVDDDMRNIFALTSALQEYELDIQIANNGLEALKKLEEFPNTDIVLMDIMMPEMDGYEAMQEIRKQNCFAKLPIIALTAKAMKADREKCIEAGANDYVSKPVDMDKLLSMMRVWLS